MSTYTGKASPASGPASGFAAKKYVQACIAAIVLLGSGVALSALFLIPKQAGTPVTPEQQLQTTIEIPAPIGQDMKPCLVDAKGHRRAAKNVPYDLLMSAVAETQKEGGPKDLCYIWPTHVGVITSRSPVVDGKYEDIELYCHCGSFEYPKNTVLNVTHEIISGTIAKGDSK